MRENYNRVPVRFSGYQLPPFMANSNDDLKKKSSLKKTESTNNTSSS